MDLIDRRRDVGGANVSFSPSVVTPECVYRNARIVSVYANCLDDTGLRKNFLNAINKLQQYKFEFDQESASIRLNFGYGGEFFKASLCHIMTVDTPPLAWQYSVEERREIVKKTSCALKLIEQIDVGIYSALHVIVGTFLFGRRKHFGGGSISDMMGAIWFGPSVSWAEIDYAERIVHEYVHQCLFLDDMVHTIFRKSVEEMAEEDGLATSSILRRKRGYDKSYHSAFVAFALAQFYQKCRMPSKAQEFIDPIFATMRELKLKPRFLTCHGRQLLDELADDVARCQHQIATGVWGAKC